MGLQIDDQAQNTNSESNQRIFQCYNRCDSEKAQSRDRSEMHDPAQPRRDLINWSPVNKLPNQEHVSAFTRKKTAA